MNNFAKNLNSKLQFINYNKTAHKSIINVHSTRNNTIITLTNNNNQPITWLSSGSIGFKSSQKSGYEAGYQSTIKLFDMINQSSPDSPLHQSKFGPIEMHFRGFGQGRFASWAALLSQQGESFKQRLTLIKDKTHLVRGGTRPKKQRRFYHHRHRIILVSDDSTPFILAIDWRDSRPTTRQLLYTLEIDAPHQTLFEQLNKRDIPYTLTHTFSSDLFTGASILLNNHEDRIHLPLLQSVKHVYPINSFDNPANSLSQDSLDLSTQSAYNSQLYPLVSGTQALPSHSSVQLLSASALRQSAITQAHERNLTGDGIFIAFIDDGVDYTHPGLGGCFGENCPISHGWDLVGDTYNTTTHDISPGPLGATTCKSHGTSTIGVAASQLEQLPGAAPNATFGMYRIFGCYGSSGDDVLAMGLIKAYEDGADIINISAGGPDGWTTSLPSVVASRIVEKGRHVVTSAGNYGLQGLLYSNSPAGGIGVTPVASTDLPYVPYLNASLTMESKPGDRFPYVPATSFNKMNVTVPAYILDKSGNSTSDACNNVTTSDKLDDVAVIIKPGGCSIGEKLENLKSANASLVLISDINGNLTSSPAVEGLDTAIINLNTTRNLLDGENITLHYTPILQENPRDGLISQYSSMGPSADGYGKPAVGAPGANIPTLAPGNNYMIQSGTSFSAPYYSSMLALLLQDARRKGQMLKPDVARALMLNGATSVMLDDDIPGPAFTVLQGSGVANLTATLDATTYALPDILNLNDTYNGVSKSHTIEVVNMGSEETTFTISHQPALTGYVLDDGTIQPRTWLPEHSTDSTEVDFPTTLTVSANSSASFDVNFSYKDIDDHRLPVYSGWIVLESPESRLQVSYNGIAGDLSKMQVLDNTDDLFQQGFPVPFAFRQSDKNLIDTVDSFSMIGLDKPAVIYRLTGPSPYLRIDLVDDTAKRNVINGVLNWMNDIFGDDERSAKSGVLYEELGVSRNGFMGSGQGSSYQRYDMDGKFANGQTIPSGTYRFHISALKVHGDENNNDDYETWLSEKFTIK
ncbi:subtilisin-like protein [Wallemia mellicola]|nr:subtilisin-like protein [Wallemia mellicola]